MKEYNIKLKIILGSEIIFIIFSILAIFNLSFFFPFFDSSIPFYGVGIIAILTGVVGLLSLKDSKGKIKLLREVSIICILLAILMIALPTTWIFSELKQYRDIPKNFPPHF